MFADIKLELNQIYDSYEPRDQEVIVYFNALYKSDCMYEKLTNDFKYLFDGSW